MKRSSGRPPSAIARITSSRCSTLNAVASPVVPSRLIASQPSSSSARQWASRRGRSGRCSASIGVAVAAMTPRGRGRRHRAVLGRERESRSRSLRRPAAPSDGTAPRSRASAPARRRRAPWASNSWRRRASSASSTRRSRRRPATSSRIVSPSRTSASGPPSAASGVMCRTIAPNAVPLMRASERRTMSLTPCVAELLRDRQVAGLGHAGRADRAGVAQHEHVVGADVEVGRIDPRRHVLDRIEDDGAAGVLQEARASPPTA